MIGGAAFSDGRTAGRTAAELRLSNGALEIRRAADGVLLARWPVHHLVRLPAAAGTALRLTCRSDPDARLSVRHAETVAWLEAAAPALARPSRRRHPAVWAIWLAGAVAGCVFLYQALLWLPRPLARLVPLRWEASVGATVVEPILQHLGGACRGQAGQAALDELGRRLAEAGGLNVPLHLYVVKNPQVNAFALPGGHIVVLSGLVTTATSADELAGVLAHEMSHVALRHVTEQTIRSLGVGWMVLAITGEPASVSASVIATSMRLAYSRNAESEADAMAIRLLRQADISTQAFSDFFRRLAAREKASGTLPDFLSDHPPTAGRGANLPAQSVTRPALPDADWRALRQICD